MGGVSFTLGGEEPPHRFTCSRAGCTAKAEWAIRWRNPKIHDSKKHKSWLSCAEHLEYLREFLALREFPIAVVAIGELDD